MGTAPLHAALVEAPRKMALPFALESTLHERSKAAASRLSGLDNSRGTARRALHAMNQRAALARSQRPRSVDELSAMKGVLVRHEPPQQHAVFDAAAAEAEALLAAGADAEAPSPSESFSGYGFAPADAAVDGTESPRILSPRSLQLLNRSPRKSPRKVRARWALVRKNLWRIVRDERERLGLARPDSGGSGGGGAWSVAMSDWRTRTAEAALRNLESLRPYTEHQLKALMSHTSLTTLPRYAQLFKRGLPCNCCQLLVRGSLRLSESAEGSSRRVLEAGALIGGGAWLPCALHADTATALTPCVLVTIRAAEARGDDRLTELCERLAVSMGDPWKVELLRWYVPLFTDLPPRSLGELGPLFTPRLVEPGGLIIEEGEIGEEVFVLVQGEVRVFKGGTRANPKPVELTRINDQAEVTYFGELALYHRRPRSASVQAVDRCFLLVLEAAHFETFESLVPDFNKRTKVLTLVASGRAKDAADAEAAEESFREAAASHAPQGTSDASFLRSETSSRVSADEPIRRALASAATPAEPLSAWVDALAAPAPTSWSKEYEVAMKNVAVQQRRSGGLEREVLITASAGIGLAGLSGMAVSKSTTAARAVGGVVHAIE